MVPVGVINRAHDNGDDADRRNNPRCPVVGCGVGGGSIVVWISHVCLSVQSRKPPAEWRVPISALFRDWPAHCGQSRAICDEIGEHYNLRVEAELPLDLRSQLERLDELADEAPSIVPDEWPT